MLIVIASDVHGSSFRLRTLEKAYPQADLFLCAGDFNDPDFDQNPWLSVAGNNDRPGLLPQTRIVKTGQGNIYMEHGDRYPAKIRVTRLAEQARQNDCQVAVFGHTHRPLIEQHENVYVINPGSLYRSRGEIGISYALLHWDEKECRATLHSYYDLPESVL